MSCDAAPSEVTLFVAIQTVLNLTSGALVVILISMLSVENETAAWCWTVMDSVIVSSLFLSWLGFVILSRYLLFELSLLLDDIGIFIALLCEHHSE